MIPRASTGSVTVTTRDGGRVGVMQALNRAGRNQPDFRDDGRKEVTGRDTEASTSGGTSDGRFIATMGTQVVELGPVNATIHQVDERVLASDLDVLTEIYYQTLVNLLA